MKQNIQTQWQNAIQTQHLRESVAAYNAFKVSCQNPQWTLKQLSENINQKLKTVNDWSHKYFWESRRQAYYKHLHEELDEQVLMVKKNDLQAHLERQSTDNNHIDNDQALLSQMQADILSRVEKGQTISKEQLTEYLSFKDSYMKSQKEHAATTQLVIKNVYAGVDADKFNTDEMSIGARRLVESIQQRRDENDE